MKPYIDWVLRAQAGDLTQRNAAFDQLARDFQGMVYSVAYSRLSDPQLAEDAAQDALLAAYESIAQLQDARAFPAWLKRIAQSKADKITRSQGPATSAIGSDANLAAADPSPEAQAQAQELRGRVREAVEALPAAQRNVTRAYYLWDASQREIADGLNIPLATVKKRLQYARAQLRGLLSDFNETFDRALKPEQTPRRLQPVYLYRRRPSEPPR